MAHIWLLLGQKTGDNAQALRLARALNLPFDIKRLVLKPEFETAKPKVDATLAYLDLEKSDGLDAPWPDLVITIGRRMASAALWIKAQSESRTRLVLIGAPKGDARQFDLVIAPIQYQVDESPRVCRIGLPLLAIDDERLQAAHATWAPRLAHLPGPLTVFLLGGSMGARPLSARTALTWLAQIEAQRASQGSLYVSTSRRTPETVFTALQQAVPAGAALYRWRADDRDNPYLGLLALADRFVVSADSISMLVEVARLGKPMLIAADHAKPTLLERLGLARRTRDFALLHNYLIDGGWAAPLGRHFPQPKAPPPDDTGKAATRVLELLQTQYQRS